MAKVGIITMHRVENSGSALQAYATQYTIEKLGYDCEIIDYQYPNVYQFERGTYKYPAWRNIMASRLWWLRPEWTRLKKFEWFRKKHLKVSSFFDSPQSIESASLSYDIYLTGSDQVWNPKYTKGDPTFMLGFVDNKKRKVAYSASFTAGKLDGCHSDSFKSLLRRYDAIAVRETCGKEIIKNLLGKDVPVVLDPTLLLAADEWNRLLYSRKKNPYRYKKYILVYALDHTFNPAPALYDVIRRVQEQTLYEIVSIGRLDENKISDYKAELEVGPIEFLQLFKHASYVVTSSFHGTAFAINFGKTLFPIVCPSSMQDGRQTTLLESLGMERGIIRSDTHVESLDMDMYAEVSNEGNLKLKERRKESIGCLAGMLAGNDLLPGH